VRANLDRTSCRDKPADPADRGDQLDDRVLGGDRILQDRGVQHPPASSRQHPGRLHHLADRVEDPPWPVRSADAVAPVHQHRWVEPLIVKAQPARHLPGDVPLQRTDRLPVAQALQRLQHHDAGNHLGGHRRVAPTLAGQIRERLGPKQLVAVVGEKRIHRPVGDQVAAPGGRVHLVIGGMACWAHAPAVCLRPAPSANHRIDPISQIDNTDRNTPVQQAPS
jgi:hypothetical protein